MSRRRSGILFCRLKIGDLFSFGPRFLHLDQASLRRGQRRVSANHLTTRRILSFPIKKYTFGAASKRRSAWRFSGFA